MENKSSQSDNKKKLIVFNEALEYFDKSNGLNEIEIDESQSLGEASILLQELMLNELDNLKGIIGNNPELKIKEMNEEEKLVLKQFIQYYSSCPICKQKNHVINLKKLYFNEDEQLIENLARMMQTKNKKLRKYNVQFGIPCCNCFKQFFNED
ncbi:MAG: hypothetical protein ACFFBP_04315 [Promethearchaeota archaeon]